MLEIHLQKLPASPAFSNLYSQSLLSSCIMPPHLSSSLALSLPPSLPCRLPLSVLLCLSSSCIAPPALWCNTDNQNSAHTHTGTHGGTHTQGDTHPPIPVAPLPLLHLSTADTKHSTTPGVLEYFIKRQLQALHQKRRSTCTHCG